MDYRCIACDYKTVRKYDYNKHLSSAKHLINLKSQKPDEIAKDLKEAHNDKLIIMKNLSDEKDKRLDDKDKMIDILREEINTYKMILNTCAISNKNVSPITYLITNYKDAPVLTSFNDMPRLKTSSLIKFKDEEPYATKLAYYKKHGLLVKHISECIISVYKMEDKSKQAVWNTDTSRLTYIIRKLVPDNTINWSVDKKGNQTCELLIDPILTYINEELTTYMTNIYDDMADMNQQQIEDTAETLLHCANIKKEIDDKILSNNILKEISPAFFLNKT